MYIVKPKKVINEKLFYLNCIDIYSLYIYIDSIYFSKILFHVNFTICHEQKLDKRKLRSQTYCFCFPK